MTSYGPCLLVPHNVCIVLSTVYQGWSVWPILYGTSNELWVSLPGQNSHYCLSLLSAALTLGKPTSVLWGHSSSPMERSMWQGTETSRQYWLWGHVSEPPWKWILKRQPSLLWLQLPLTSWLLHHESSETTTTPLSCSWIPDDERFLRDNTCLLLQVTRFWSNFFKQ